MSDGFKRLTSKTNMAGDTLKLLKCLAFYSFLLSIQSTYGHYELKAAKNCMRRLPFIIKTPPKSAETNICPLIRLAKPLKLTKFSRNTRSHRRRRSLLSPRLPLLPILPPIIPKLPLLPLPLPPPPLLPLSLTRLKKPIKPLKVPIIGKRSILPKSTHIKPNPIKIPDLNIKAGKRRILENLLKLKRKGLLSTKEFMRFRKALLK